MPERFISHEKLKSVIINKVVGPVTAAVLAFSPVATEFSPLTSTPESIITSVSKSEHSFYQDNLVLNKEGLPVGFTLTDGTVGTFDVDQVREMRQLAISSGEFQILAMFPNSPTKYYSDAYYRNMPPSIGTKEHPVFLTLPKVLSDKELAANGTYIINTENISLYIKPQAYGPDGPFAELAGKGGSENLTIVLVPGPAVARIFLEGDPRYKEVINLLPNLTDNVTQFRQEKVAKLNAQLELLRGKFKDPKEMAANYSSNQYDMLTKKAQIYAYEKKKDKKDVITDKQILEEKAVEPPSYNGLYYSGVSTNESQNGNTIISEASHYNNRTIFVAVGRLDRDWLTKKVVYFGPNGEVFLDSKFVAEQSGWNFTPSAGESYPDPKYYSINPKASPDDPSSYLYGTQSAGFGLGHEAEHDLEIAQAVNEGKEPNGSEYNTDNQTALRLGRAFKKWMDSGDDSGYCFVFRLLNGTYILTFVPKLNKTSS